MVSGIPTIFNRQNPADQGSRTSRGALLRAPQVLTSGTSYVPPRGCRAIVVECVGGGGGGGGASSAAVSAAAGGGGGGGGYCRQYYDAPGKTFTYAIGTGGAGGSSAGGNGSDGGTTTFTDGTVNMFAFGGGLGIGMTAGTSQLFANGGDGGVGSPGAGTGGVTSKGSPATPGLRLSGTVAACGTGGSNVLGGGGPMRSNGGATQPAGGFGGGGAGGTVVNGSTARAGGNGTDGVVIITEYR